MTPPVLRTILDLPPARLPLEMSPAQLTAMQMFVGVERRALESGGSLFASAADIVAMPGLDRSPAMVGIVAHRLNDFRPHTQLSPLLLGVVAAAYGSPGTAVQWAHAFAAWHARTGIPASVGGLISRHLGGCLPDESSLLELWDAQKNRDPQRSGTDNWLDYPEAWTDEALCAAQTARGEGQFVAQPSG